MPTVEIRLLEQMAKKDIRTIQEVHEKSGLSRKAITNILNNKNIRVKADTIAKLCQALDCEIGDLVVIKKKNEEWLIYVHSNVG